ncbi:protein kinase [Streptomyces sp. 7N604]|uniref:protein kinase n=1 Tax=Streptomyces sp. 7N604 TaxID=3457415 RepID=UPI003FD21567
MDDYAGRVLADRYRLPRPPSDAYELMETRAFDTYSGQEVLVRQIPLPEVVEAEVVDADGRYGGNDRRYGGNDGRYGAAGAGGGGPDPRRPADPAVRRAIDAAATAAGLPDHPRLDQVFDVFAEGGSLWVVSEWVAARPLAALLAERPMSPHRAAEVAADILTALRALHAHGWIHRNITVRTVLVCDDGRAMLTGLAAGAAEEALCGYDPIPGPPAGERGPSAGPAPTGGGPAAGGPAASATPAVEQRTPGARPHAASGAEGSAAAHPGEAVAPKLPGPGDGWGAVTGPGAAGSQQSGRGTGAGPGSVGAGGPESGGPGGGWGAGAGPGAAGGQGADTGGAGGAGEHADHTNLRAARAGAIAAYRAGARAAAQASARLEPDAHAPGLPAPRGHNVDASPVNPGAEGTPWAADSGGGNAASGSRSAADDASAAQPPTGPGTSSDASWPPEPTAGNPNGVSRVASPYGDVPGDTYGGAAAHGWAEGDGRSKAPEPRATQDPSSGGFPGAVGRPVGSGSEGPGFAPGEEGRSNVPEPRGAQGSPSGGFPGAGRQAGGAAGRLEGSVPPGREAGPSGLPAPRGGYGAGGRPEDSGSEGPASASGEEGRSNVPEPRGSQGPPSRGFPGAAGAASGAGAAGRAAHDAAHLGRGAGGEAGGDVDRGAPDAYRGPTTRLAAERARQARMVVVGAVTERWAPEQAGPVHENWQLAPPIGPATDLWALGALLFRAVQGHAPFPEESAAELVQLVCSEPPAFAEECGPLRPVVESLLRQDPTERPDFEELRGWLRSLVRSAPEPDLGSRAVTVPSLGSGEPADPRRLPVVRRRGELVRRRRTAAPAVARGRHKRAREKRVRGGGARGPRSLGRTLVGLILLALIAAIAYAALFMPGADEDGSRGRNRQEDRTGAAGAASSAPAPGPTADGDGTPRSQEPQSTEPADLPKGFAVRKDPAGFALAVHEDWERRGENSRGQIRYLGGDHELIVVPGRDSVADFGADPMAYQQDKERELEPFRDSQWSSASGLRRIDVGSTAMAEGTFNWKDTSGREVYARNLAMIVDGRYHLILVIGPADEREALSEFYQQAADTYRTTG